MFHNMLLTGLTPLCNTNEINGWENRPFTTVWPETQKNKTKTHEVSKTIKKKAKRFRTAFTTDQLRMLEYTFSRFRYIDGQYRRELAQEMKIGEKAIKIWFQNRRMKEKRDSDNSGESSNESYSTSSSPLNQQYSEVSRKMVEYRQPEVSTSYAINIKNALSKVVEYAQSAVISTSSNSQKPEGHTQVVETVKQGTADANLVNNQNLECKEEEPNTYQANAEDMEAVSSMAEYAHSGIESLYTNIQKSENNTQGMGSISKPASPDTYQANNQIEFKQVVENPCAFQLNTFERPNTTQDDSQYILPPYYYNGYFQNNSCNATQQSAFCYDSNVYPTQYYPTGDYHSNVHSHCENGNYWVSNGYGLSYY